MCSGTYMSEHKNRKPSKPSKNEMVCKTCLDWMLMSMESSSKPPLYVCAFCANVSNSSTQCIAASPLKFRTLATFGAQTDLWDMKGKKFQQLLNMPTSCTTQDSLIHVHWCFKKRCILQLLDGIGDKKEILGDLRHLECGGFTQAGVCKKERTEAWMTYLGSGGTELPRSAVVCHYVAKSFLALPRHFTVGLWTWFQFQTVASREKPYTAPLMQTAWFDNLTLCT